MNRDPETIQQEIEHARAELARTVDELATRTSPKRLAVEGKRTITAKAKSPVGLAVMGVAALLVGFAVLRRVRR